MLRSRRKPCWMMNLKKAEAIERLAQLHDLDVEELVDEVLKRLGTPSQTITTRKRLMPQLEWLLAGKPLGLAPYYERFYETADYPFLAAYRGIPTQVEVTIDEFIAMAAELEG